MMNYLQHSVEKLITKEPMTSSNYVKKIFSSSLSFIYLFIFFFKAIFISLKHTLKKKGRAFGNIEEIYFADRPRNQPCSFLYYLFYNLLLIRSFTTGSSTLNLSRWSFQTQSMFFY